MFDDQTVAMRQGTGALALPGEELDQLLGRFRVTGMGACQFGAQRGGIERVRAFEEFPQGQSGAALAVLGLGAPERASYPGPLLGSTSTRSWASRATRQVRLAMVIA
ncbi:MAG: hypothetical protein ACOCZK_01355 [Planctomycetota bacterium]